MFLERADVNGSFSNDSQGFILQESFISYTPKKKGEIYIQIDDRGYVNQGQKHIKATLDSDHQKSFLIQVDDKEDSISILKKKIGERVESTYEIFNGLKGLQASKIFKKQPVLTVLNDNQKVQDVLIDNEEVFFELVSSDIWLQVVFQMKEQDDIFTCGATEFKIDKADTVVSKFQSLQMFEQDGLKKKLQKYLFDLWWESKKGTDVLYIVNQFDMMTLEEYIIPDFKGSNQQADKSVNAAQLPIASPTIASLNNRFQEQKVASKNSPFSRMLADIMLIDVIRFENFGEIKIGDMLSYKNKMFININFIPIFKNVQFLKQQIIDGQEIKVPPTNDNIHQDGEDGQSDYSDDDDQEIDDDDELDKTFDQLEQYKDNKKQQEKSISLLNMQNINRKGDTKISLFGAANKHKIFMPLRLSGGNNSATYNQDSNSIELQQFANSVIDHESFEENLDSILRDQTYKLVLLHSRNVENKQIIMIIKELYKKEVLHREWLEKEKNKNKNKKEVKTNKNNQDQHQKISISNMPSTVNNNSSQKIVEITNNGLRNSTGYLNHLGNKGQKSDKNQLNTYISKGSHSIPNFQSRFQATIPPNVQFKNSNQYDEFQQELRRNSFEDRHSQNDQKNKGSSVGVPQLSDSHKNYVLRVNTKSFSSKLIAHSSATPTTSGGYRSNPHQAQGFQSFSHKRSQSKDPFEPQKSFIKDKHLYSMVDQNQKLYSISNERDEDLLEASVSQEFLMETAGVRSGVRKNELTQSPNAKNNIPNYESPQEKKQREGKPKFFDNENISSLGARRSEMINRSQKFDEERDLLLKLQPIVETNIQISKESSQDNITRIIFDNLHVYSEKDFNSIIPSYLATYEDIKKLKQPKVRNVQVQSKSDNFLGQQLAEGVDENEQDKKFDPDSFFANLLNSFYQKFNMSHNQKFQDIETKTSCFNHTHEKLCLTLGITIITAILVYAYDPYEINELIIEYFNWILEYITDQFFIDPVNDDSGAWEIHPSVGVSFEKTPQVNESYKQ